MTRTQFRACGCALAALGLVAAAVASRAAQAHQPPPESGVKLPAPAAGRDAEVEALRKEVAALRDKLAALDKKDAPRPERTKVVVTTPVVKDVIETHRYTGKVAAHHHITVRALVPGVSEEVLVREGQAVKKGDILLKKVAVLQRGRLDVETADVQVAEIELTAVRRLVKERVVSAQEVALNEAKLARAHARAKLAEAELAFTQVRAPFDGVVGRFRQQAGALLKEGDDITTLSDNGVVWVYFNVPEARYLEFAGKREPNQPAVPLDLVPANGTKFPHVGKLGAIEATFQSDTGTIPFRADFPNPDRLLRHGQTGVVLMHEPLKGVTVIPRRAVFDADGKLCVFVVGKDDVARRRAITIQAELDGHVVVKQGLAATDRVVVEGHRQLRDGDRVESEFRRPEDAAATPAAP